jgi:hypothetical protein
MRFLSLVVGGILFAASAHASCTYDCMCKENSKQGQYCGYCPEVISCQEDEGDCYANVYECNPQGGCCLYGYRDSCVSTYEQCPIQV